MADAFPLISILVLTRNRKREVRRCLDSALAQSCPLKEIVVVDNASDDGTAEFLNNNFPSIKVVTLTSNLGCPTGRNVGVAHCTGDFVYFLDDDGWLEEKAVERAAARALCDPAIGVVMSQIQLVKDGRVCETRPAGRTEPAFQAEFTGCCALVRRDIFARLRGFPDDFFRQAEESDFALRMLDAGYYCFYEPTSIMYHEPSPSGRNNRQFLYYSLRNTSKTALRHWPFPYCVLKIGWNVCLSLKFLWVLRYPALPFQLMHELSSDLRTLAKQRQPVRMATYRLYRQLLREPSHRKPS